jgi:hypothetical protein
MSADMGFDSPTKTPDMPAAKAALGLILALCLAAIGARAAAPSSTPRGDGALTAALRGW